MEVDEKYVKALLMQYVVLEGDGSYIRPQDIQNQADDIDRNKNNTTAALLANSICEHVGGTKINKQGTESPVMDRITIGRFLGLFGGKRGHFSLQNLNILARYLGFNSWENVLNKRQLKDYIFSNARINDDKIKSVYAGRKAAANDEGIDYLLPNNIPAGYFVEIRYGDAQKLLKLRKVRGREDRFVVVESNSSKLRSGFSMTVPFFVLGNNLVGTDIRETHNMQVSGLYRASGIVRSIRVTVL